MRLYKGIYGHLFGFSIRHTCKPESLFSLQKVLLLLFFFFFFLFFCSTFWFVFRYGLANIENAIFKSQNANFSSLVFGIFRIKVTRFAII